MFNVNALIQTCVCVYCMCVTYSGEFRLSPRVVRSLGDKNRSTHTRPLCSERRSRQHTAYAHNTTHLRTQAMSAQQLVHVLAVMLIALASHLVYTTLLADASAATGTHTHVHTYLQQLHSYNTNALAHYCWSADRYPPHNASLCLLQAGATELLAHITNLLTLIPNLLTLTPHLLTLTPNLLTPTPHLLTLTPNLLTLTSHLLTPTPHLLTPTPHLLTLTPHLLTLTSHLLTPTPHLLTLTPHLLTLTPTC